MDGETFRVGIDWLKANAKPAIPPLCKHRVLCIVERLFDDASLPQEAEPREVLSLVIQMQPIALEHTGTWQKLSELLVHLLRGNPPSFQWLVKALAAEPSDIFVEAVQNEGRLGELLSEMHGLDLSDFASELTFSSRRAERRIGLKFFDALHLTKFAAERLSAASDVDLQRVLCESITMPFYGEEIARLLLALLSRAEIAGADVRQRFATEILTQAKSLPTACAKTFKAAGTDSALLRDAVTMGEKWFERWSAGFSSAVNAFGVPGLSAAREFDEKRRSRQMRKSVSEGSVWAQIVKETMLLYSHRFSSAAEGELSTPTGLEEFGASVEVPLLEAIDPEGMALRRIRTEMELERLGTSNTPEERHEG